ncbi:hypothetical protein [Salinisphaera sp. T31B1]|uniref:hypothetical protein n=1 Tax=Salinisphaera sp. T31B1 TaxID=727963 RepID=UPI0033414239
MENSDKENLLYRKQFLLMHSDQDNEFAKPLSAWSKVVWGDYELHLHPDLPYEHASVGRIEIVCLGIILDPDNPANSSRRVIENITRQVEDSESLELELERMGGRFVLCCRMGGRHFLYHDACGFKTVFLYSDGHHRIVASQPQIVADLLGLKRARDYTELLKKYRSPTWPPYVYPFDNFKQLLPNRRIDLNTYTVARFWPKQDPELQAVPVAVDRIYQDTQGLMRAILARYSGYVSLTGGHDSRAVAAVAAGIGGAIEAFSFNYRGIPRHDAVLPGKIANIAGLKHVTHESSDFDEYLLDILDRNSSYMCFDPSRREAEALGRILGSGGVNMQGFIGELLRNSFGYIAPAQASAESLAKRAFMPPLDFVHEGTLQWLSEAPVDSSILADLLYWDVKMGIWGASCITCKEALAEVIPPMSSRRIISAALSVDKDARFREKALHHGLYAKCSSRLSKVKINTTHMQEFAQIFPVPWRMRKKHGLHD